ncbi:MAG: PAS domain S-box protein [Vicinamibacteria bacterium]|nr:PAS domain S-box protein [Vicinamibacteria bacterium]
MPETPPPVAPTYKALVEQALVGVYVVQDLRVVYANPRLAELFGYTTAALLALPSVLALVDSNDRAEVEERLLQRIDGASPTSTHVMRGLRNDGSVVELEVYSTRTEHDGRPAVTGTMIDATERRQRERALLAREQRYRDLIENAADIVYTCDLEGRITSLNRAGQQLTGYSAAEATTMRIADFVTGAQRALVDELIQRQVRERQVVTAEFEIVTRQGERRVLEVSTRLIQRDGTPVEIQGIARDVTERREQEQTLRSLTIIDDLTKLYNRRGFLTLAERHLKLAARKKTGVFLLFADLDGLKLINDTFGHLEGDRALIDAADILRNSFRSADIIARLGGDEFTVFPIEAATQSASILIGRLDEHLQRHNEVNKSRGYRLALSVGIARFEPDSSWSIDQLLEHADKALYQQKRQRRS